MLSLAVVLAILAGLAVVLVLTRATPKPKPVADDVTTTGRRATTTSGSSTSRSSTDTVTPVAPTPLPTLPNPSTGPAAGSANANANATGTTSYTMPVTDPVAAKDMVATSGYPSRNLIAPCGVPALSPVDGTIDEINQVDNWPGNEPGGADGPYRGGLYLSIIGNDNVRYYLSSLGSIGPGIVPNQQVSAGQQVGTVGQTGSARAGSSCALHVGFSRPCQHTSGDWQIRRGQIDPLPYFQNWQSGGSLSPAASVASAPACL
jgi:murein DD-endopeptidase MepM/ murein hydrolase activator NlpD